MFCFWPRFYIEVLGFTFSIFFFGLLFPFSFWTCNSLFTLDFYFPFLFGLSFISFQFRLLFSFIYIFSTLFRFVFKPFFFVFNSFFDQVLIFTCCVPEIPPTWRRMPPLPTTKDILRLYRIKAKKSLSQNFIMDPRILQKFVKTAGMYKQFLLWILGVSIQLCRHKTLEIYKQINFIKIKSLLNFLKNKLIWNPENP